MLEDLIEVKLKNFKPSKETAFLNGEKTFKEKYRTIKKSMKGLGKLLRNAKDDPKRKEEIESSEMSQVQAMLTELFFEFDNEYIRRNVGFFKRFDALELHDFYKKAKASGYKNSFVVKVKPREKYSGNDRDDEK